MLKVPVSDGRDHVRGAPTAGVTLVEYGDFECPLCRAAYLTRRGIEYGLLPWCRQRGIVIMAYPPIEQGRLLGHPALRRVAERHHATAAQVALAWVLRNDGICAIPKSSRPEHVVENHAALELSLSKQDLADLDHAFARPTAKQALEVI